MIFKQFDRFHEQSGTGSSRVSKKIRFALFSLLTLLFTLLICWQSKFSGYVKKSKIEMFNEYIDSKAQLIKPTVSLKKEYQSITWPNFGALPKVGMSVVFTSSGTRHVLPSALRSFFEYNSYPVQKVIVVYDGVPYEKLRQLIQQYANITWLIMNAKIGQLAAIDQAYRLIQTQYYFHAEDDWDYIKPGFIQYCLQSLQLDSKLIGVALTKRYMRANEHIIVGPLTITTELEDKYYSAFSLNPSVHRMKDYKLLSGGYINATHNFSFASGAGECQLFLGIEYFLRGYFSGFSQQLVPFVKHTGTDIGNPKKYIPRSSKHWARAMQAYEKQYSKLSQQKIKENLKYLYENYAKMTAKETQNTNGKDKL